MATKDLKSIKFPGLPDTYEVPAGGGGGGTVTEADIEKALGYKPIGADDVPVKKVNGATGNIKTSWYFNVTGSVASPATTQTAAQIVAAQEAGFAPICSATFSDFQGLPATLPALLISDAVCVFGGIGSTGGNTFYLTVMIDGAGNLTAKTDDVAAKSDIPTIPTALKNPNALNIKIGSSTTSYDGSVPKTVEIPEGTDGYSPSASVAQTDTGATITITDKSGTTTATVKNGKDGAPGTPGTNGTDGKDGTTFTPSVSTAGDLSWTNDGGKANPAPVNIKGQKGSPGITPNIQIGTVTTLPAGSDATASMGGTTENPVLNLGIPKGADGATGLPTVTADDNGKFLRVVNGAWAAAELLSAGGVSF